jgi:hypothetical protein
LGPAAAVFAISHVAGAGEGRVDVHVDCPGWSQEASAEIEARARAQLATAGDVSVSVVCAPESATVSLTRSSAIRRLGVAVSGSPRDAFDALLDAIASLVAESDHTLAPLADRERPTTDGALHSDAASRSHPPHRILPSVAMDAELWQGSVPVALGVRGGAKLSLPGTATVGGFLGAQWGVQARGDTAAWALRAAVRAEVDPVRHLRIGGAVEGRVMFASESGSSGTTQQQAVTAGICVGSRYVRPLGPVDVAVGPEMEAMVRPMAVDVASVEMFRVPIVVVGASIELTRR